MMIHRDGIMGGFAVVIVLLLLVHGTANGARSGGAGHDLSSINLRLTTLSE